MKINRRSLMKTPLNPTILFGRLLAVAFVAAAGATASGQAFVVVENQGETRRVEVQRIATRTSDGELVLYREDADPITVKPGQYRRAVGVKPPELDEAIQEANGGNTQKAVSLLREVMKKSRFQSWDARAGTLLVDFLLEEGDTRAAASVLRQLEQTYGDDLTDLYPETQLVEWKVKIATGSISGLQEDLTEKIHDPETGRELKAMAQMVRGDLKSRREEYRSAVLDYLRTAYFYPDVEEVNAEALYKTADTFDTMGDAVRSRKYRQRLQERHPDSSFAGKPVGN